MSKKKPEFDSKVGDEDLKAFWNKDIGKMTPEELSKWIDQLPVSDDKREEIRSELLGDGKSEDEKDE